jgi:hypothetical protein
MGLLSSRKQALAAIVEPQPENTMVVIKPDGHGAADVSIAKAKVPSLYFYTKGVVVPNQSVWYSITTGGQFRANQFGIFEGSNGSSKTIAPGDRDARFLCHEDAYTEESVEDLREKLDNICRPLLLDWLDWMVVAKTLKMDLVAVREYAKRSCGILLTVNQNDIVTAIECTWGQFFLLAQHIEEFKANRQFGELKPGDPGIKNPEQMEKYDEICIWAQENGISPTTVFAQWGPIRREHGCTDASFTLLEEKVERIINSKAKTAEKEVFGLSVSTQTQDLPIKNTSTAATPAPIVTVDVKPASKPVSNVPAEQVIQINTETGEIEMPREEFLWLLKLQDSQLDSFETTELENVDKLLWACCALQADCFKIAQLATAAINKNLSFMAGLLYKYAGGLREYTEPKLKKGTKTWKSPNLTGSVHYKKTGGWRCTNKSELLGYVKSLPDAEIEKLGWARIDVVIDQKAANKWVKENNLKLPGYELVPIQEHGIMQVGDGKPFSLPKLRTALKSIKISNLTNYLGSDDDDDESGED